MKGFVLSLLAIALLWACKGTEEPDMEIGPDEAGLTISISSEDVTSRGASTTTSLTGENKINNVFIYVYNAVTGKILASATVNSSNFINGVATKEIGKIPTDLVNVVAIANVDMTGRTTETFSGLMQEKLIYNPIDYTTNGLPMSAIAKDKGLTKGEKTTVILNLERIVAKVNVKWNVVYDNSLPIKSYNLLRCYVLNGRNTTTLVANPNLSVSDKLYYGYEKAKLPEADVADDDNFVKGTLVYDNKFDKTASVSGNSVSFYLFENNSTNEDLGNTQNRTFRGSKFVLEFEIEYENETKSVTTYITGINAFMDNVTYETETAENGTYVKRNNIYNVNYSIQTMGGEPSDSEPTPWEPVLSRDLFVELHVLDWNLTINQTVQF